LLQGLAHDNIPSEVADATGVKGAWDFTLRFTPLYWLQNAGANGSPGQPTAAVPGASGPAGTMPIASEPSDSVSLFDALQKQLGLKLAMRKRVMPVLVIDHIEEKPTDN
jgi:uncharacterized protein (TIGR03435 family)